MELSSQIDQVVSAAMGLDVGECRALIAIAGPPASGKSTLAKRVQARLTELSKPCGLVPMDGFHLSNEILQERGLLGRKGAPETFDVDSFKALIERLGTEDDVPVPLFNRDLDRVEQDKGHVSSAQRHVVVEGNYLLMKTAPWNELAGFWSLCVFIAPSREVLEKRLIQRWITHGLDPEAAKMRAVGNDLVNALTVIEGSNQSSAQFEFG
ncbi:MAG: hypothetical protein AAGD04_04345 [Pseudomonadota bacterium]